MDDHDCFMADLMRKEKNWVRQKRCRENQTLEEKEQDKAKARLRMQKLRHRKKNYDIVIKILDELIDIVIKDMNKNK